MNRYQMNSCRRRQSNEDITRYANRILSGGGLVMSESKEQQPEYAAPNWKQINATIYQLVDDGAGHQVNRFSFNVQSNNRQLKPGEAEQIAAMILREHNSYEALVWAIRDVRERHKAKAKACNFDDCGCPDCEALEPALALAEEES